MTQNIEVPRIPLAVANQPLYAELEKHLPVLNRGKVRITYALPDYPELLLVVATDQISIFDFVLSVLIHLKGYVLTAMNVFWKTGPLGEFETDLVAYGGGIDQYLPAELRGNPDLQRRALVVRRLVMVPIECIARACLTGSGWKDYQANDGLVCGHQLAPGLNDGSFLPNSIFTPSTKSETDHDQNIDYLGVREKYGEALEQLTLRLFEKGCQVAAKVGITLADTKFEFGIANAHGSSDEIPWLAVGSMLYIGDESLTPDSSRYWPEDAWRESQSDPDPAKRTSPPSLDKQYVRNYGDEIARQKLGKGLGALKPSNPADRQWVQENVIPPQTVIDTTSELYWECHLRLIGKTLEDFQEGDMNCVPF